MEDWETFVDPHFDKVVSYLRPSLLMDKLRAKGLVTRSEYSELQSLATEKQRSQRLINDLLPVKGSESLSDFCMILRAVNDRGQEYIANLIDGRDRVVSRDNRADAQSTVSPEMADLQLAISSKVMARKRKRDLEDDGSSCPTATCTRSAVQGSPRTATFYFKPEHRVIVEDGLGDLIKSLCQDYFKIEKDKVLFGYGDVTKYLKTLGYPVFADTDTKLAVLLVSGLEPPQVEKYKDNIEQSIIGTFRRVDPTLPKEASLVLEILPNCSFIVLYMSTPAFLALLSTLGDKQRRTRMCESLLGALPASQNVLLRLGGLPPLELCNNSMVVPANAKVNQGDNPLLVHLLYIVGLLDCCMHSCNERLSCL